MRLRWALPVLVAMALALGGWALASKGVVPTCKAAEWNSPELVHRGGYALACGPGSAVVKFKGTTYRMQGSRCFLVSEGPGLFYARLYFGAQRLELPLAPPRNALYLVVKENRKRAVTVVDGGVDLASGFRSAVLGKAQAEALGLNRLRRGTFTVFEHLGDGKTSSRRFTGRWNC